VLVGSLGSQLPGALTALSQTDVPVAVVTSFRHASALARLRHAGLPTPRVVVGADDVLHGKPDPEPYRRGAELLGVTADACVGVDDSPAGIAAVLASGATAIAVTTNHAADRFPYVAAVLTSLSDLRITPGAVAWG